MYAVVLVMILMSICESGGIICPEHSYAVLPVDSSLPTLGVEIQLPQGLSDRDIENMTDVTGNKNATNDHKNVNQDLVDPTVHEIRNQDSYLGNFHLTRRQVLGDGNCLFRAISQVLVGNEESHVNLRFTAAEYMRNNLDMFRPFFLSNEIQDSDQHMLHEINLLSQNGVYAGQECVVALSRALGVNILVTHGGTVQDPRVFTMQHHSEPQSDINLHIIFSNLGGGHYDAVVEMRNSDFVPFDFTEKQYQQETSGKNVVWNETPFSNLFSLSNSTRKQQKIHISETNSNAFCDICRKSFYDNSGLKRHTVKLHPEKGLSFNKMSKYHLCMIPTCLKHFRTVKGLLNHLETDHSATIEKIVKSFSNYQEFNSWKETEEISNNVFFIKQRSKSKSASKITYQYVCNRSGVKRCHRKFQNNYSKKLCRRNIKGSCKINSLCPSRMYVTQDITSGEVKVVYYQTHSHSVSFDQAKYLPMPKHLRENISRKLSLGIPVDAILDDIQHNVGNLASRNTDDLQYFQLVNRQNIMNMKRKIVDCKYKRDDRDEISTLMWVTELQSKSSHNPVLLFKQQGVLDKSMPLLFRDDFMLVLMTNEQADMYSKFGSRVVCMDSTHKTNHYGFKLITLLVVDEYHKGYPVAFCISNREDAVALEMFLKSVKLRSPDTKINTLLTDDDLAGISAAKAVFGDELSHYLCVWHVLQTWRRKLQSVVNKDHRVEIFFFLHSLLNSKTENEYQLYLNKFTSKYSTLESSFLKYFQTNYLSRPKKWALHLRQKDLQTEITTNMFVESFHNKLKTIYFERKQNKRIDKLISVLLDMEKHYYLHRIKYTSFNKPEDFNHPYISACHSASKEITQDMIFKINENEYSVKSSDINVAPYSVTRLISSCNLNSCFQKCKSLPCVDLCSHMYICSCPNIHPMCKHIHKIHSLNFDSTITSNSESEMVHTKNINENLQRIKDQRLMLKYHQAISTLSNQLNDPCIRFTRLESIISELERMITSNEASKSIKKAKKMEPKYKVSANQNFEKQPKFKRTLKSRKRLQKHLKAPSNDDKVKLLNQDPQSNIQLSVAPNNLKKPLIVKLPSGETITILTPNLHQSENSRDR